ncbi:MAG TPA: CpsD/CapB family tyrosine-protein kinase [Steroidobacteraceae bacterium]|nr:CpsD/CapB family tyrosine-protein kinase [Steroidobacteraceae bacterium]
MSTTVEDAIRRNLEIGRPNAIESSSLRRVRRVAAPAADLTQARRFHNANVDVRAMERQCVLPAVSDTAALRAFKILRTRVLRRLDMHKWNSIAVSGMSVGEGKTLTAINLALALSQDVNTFVFLVDLDLQRPQVANYLGMSFEKGLSDYLLGKAELDDIVYKLQSERLGVIPNARAFQHSSEFLNSPRMGEFTAALEREMPRRIIIFDMPPLLASDDVLAFAPQFDSLLLVVSEGKSGRAMLRGAKEILSEMNLLGVVLNRSKERNESAYY